MRSLTDVERIRALSRALGRRADAPARVYLVGGATAVLEGWRATTVDVNLRIEPDGVLFGAIRDELYRFPAVEPEALEAAVRHLADAESQSG